ncbi:MAG: hypothetical protein JO029_12040 [Candidatus Eremiobacteraeota bacterium]|nr:hypothetical protein [Candidatus Eremiobacteraeota bacterium]
MPSDIIMVPSARIIVPCEALIMESERIESDILFVWANASPLVKAHAATNGGKALRI